MNGRSYKHFNAVWAGIAFSISACGAPLRWHDPPLLALPERPVLPAVQFVEPTDPNAVTCLDHQGVENLLLTDIRLKSHIQLLEKMMEYCR